MQTANLGSDFLDFSVIFALDQKVAKKSVIACI